MRYRRIGALLIFLGLLWLLDLLLHIDPFRTGLAAVLIYGGYRLIRNHRSLVGTVHLLDPEFPFQEIDLSCGITDVKIDLSRAIIPPGEHLITIRGLVGDVNIFVPYDLDVSVVATVAAGALNVMGVGRAGLGCRGLLTTARYAEAASKVKITVALAIGDVDVRYL